MQGHQHYQEKTLFEFRLSERVPASNFYRRLREFLDWKFLYQATEKYYGKCGHKSIDPVVFFKLMLVGYLENIASDRKLIEHCSMRLDILYFLDYSLDEPLPWHSTVSRTRQLLGEEVFEALFEQVLAQCVEKGMVAGERQCMDSAFVKANASLDSLEEKQPNGSLPGPGPQRVTDEQDSASEMDADQTDPKSLDQEPKRRAKLDRSSLEQRTLSAQDFQLAELKTRQQHWRLTQKRKPGDGVERARYLSNMTHYSPTDPQARIAVKPGKPRQLCYLASISVDAAQGVITHIQADLADKKDSVYLQDLVENTRSRLKKNNLKLRQVIADTGYSSGENYVWLEKEKITGFIPVHGLFQQEREGFKYDQQKDYFTCPQGKPLPLTRHFVDREYYWKKSYRASRKDCNTCPVREACLGKKAKEKKLDMTCFHPHYQRAYSRQISKKGDYMKKLRQSTVEPVLGTLINFLALRRINTRGLAAAHKVMLLSAMAFNLKKLLKWDRKMDLANAQVLTAPLSLLFSPIRYSFPLR